MRSLWPVDAAQVASGIHAIQLLRVKAYAIIEGDDVSLVDSGYAGSLPRIERTLGARGAQSIRSGASSAPTATPTTRAAPERSRTSAWRS